MCAPYVMPHCHYQCDTAYHVAEQTNVDDLAAADILNDIADDVRRAEDCVVQMRLTLSRRTRLPVCDTHAELTSCAEVLQDIVHQMRAHLASLSEL